MIIIDQLGQKVEIRKADKNLRIISIVPSQTELLHYIGANVMAQTIFCVHPEERHKRSVKIGGTKRLHIDEIIALKPDLVIGNKEENDQSQIEELSKHVPVWMSDIVTLNDALDMIRSIGRIIEKENECNSLIDSISEDFDKLKSSIRKSGTVAYLIWNDPIMAAGRKCFINEMLERSGLENIITDRESRYPEITLEYLKEIQPDHLFLSTEPFPFKEDHVRSFEKHLPSTLVTIVDGEYFSWYGSRLNGFASYLQRDFPQFFKT